MNQSDQPFEARGSRRNRLVGVTVFVLGWGLLAVLALVWLTGAAKAGPAADSSARKGWDGTVKGSTKLVSRSQAEVRKTGEIKVRIWLRAARTAPSSVRRAEHRVRLTAKAGKPQVVGGFVPGAGIISAAVSSLRLNRPKTITMKLNARGRAMVADCGAPSLKVRVTGTRGGSVNINSQTSSTRLRPEQSLCAVPKDVDLSQGKKCEFIDDPANPCLGTYPNDFFTRTVPRDPPSGMATGKRLNLSPDATPMNKNRVHIAVDVLNQSDGFSAGPLLQVKIPGLDNQAAFDQTGLVGQGDMTAAFDSDQPAVLIDAKTGQRQLIWTELDSQAAADADRVLIIRPGRNLANGHRYIVALRNLRDRDGNPIGAPPGFRLYRDHNLTSNRLVESRRAHFESIFKTLGKAGLKRSSLNLAWDFTVASTENITGRMTSIRDRAFALLGDTNLTDGSIAGTSAPSFTVTNVEDYSAQAPPYSGRGVQNIRTVTGTFQVPCYLKSKDPGDPCGSGSTFDLDANQKPVRTEGSFQTARFTCNIPRSAVSDDGGTWTVAHQVRPSLYGHGLFGDYTEVNSTDIRQLGTENGVMVCGTDWSGMSEDDQFAAAVPALMDLSKFPALPDRLQQGFLNFLYLGRLMIHEGGLASDPAFRFDGQSVIDRSDLFYYGNSQGGIAGGALTAVATDFTRAVLYVGAMNYSTLLNRSVDFDEFAAIMDPYYPNQRERQLIFSIMQTMWDRGEPNGYANHMTSDPLPGTPAHKVLMLMAYGDHQVANVATEVEARTIGAPIRLPAVSSDRLSPGMVNPWPVHETLGALSGPAADGSGLFVWDIGPKRVEGNQLFGTDPPPLGNLAPKTTRYSDPFDSGSGIDPHDTVIRKSPLARAQIADFITTNGKITDPCGANPCWAAGWNGMP